MLDDDWLEQPCAIPGVSTERRNLRIRRTLVEVSAVASRRVVPVAAPRQRPCESVTLISDADDDASLRVKVGKASAEASRIDLRAEVERVADAVAGGEEDARVSASV